MDTQGIRSPSAVKSRPNTTSLNMASRHQPPNREGTRVTERKIIRVASTTSEMQTAAYPTGMSMFATLITNVLLSENANSIVFTEIEERPEDVQESVPQPAESMPKFALLSCTTQECRQQPSRRGSRCLLTVRKE